MAVACWAGPASAQTDPAGLSLSEVHSYATQFVNARKHREAIPFLDELVQRLKNTEEEAAWKILGYAQFHLALSQMEVEQYGKAAAGFEAYIRRFPKGPYAKGAHLLWGEVHASEQKWSDVITVMERLFRDPTLSGREKVWANQLVGEAFYRQEKWRESVSPLAYVFTYARARSDRILAAVQVTSALVRLEEFERLFDFIPYVYRTDARFDISMNLALVEAGDKNYEAENYPYALSLYRLVQFKQELVRNLALRIEKAKRDRQLVWQQDGLDRARMSAIHRKLNRLIADYEAQRIQLEELPDYNQEVIIRLAQTYLNLERYWEALTQFRRVYDRYPDHALGEQGLYSAYATALEMGQEERALKEGYDYLEAFPAGEFYEPLSVGLTQLHIRREEYQMAIDLATQALEIKPDHNLRPHLVYLMGYCHFQLNEMEPALARFAEVLDRHPNCAFIEDATYWHAMTQLFLQHYTPSREEFTAFLADFPDSGYREDASFRLAVAYYGEGNFEASQQHLLQFTETYPQSILVAEGFCMLGDITASWSQLDVALDYYVQAQGQAVNRTEIDYAAFQSARVYELEARYDEIIDLFKTYLKDYGESGNFTQAIYWIGNAYLRSDRVEAAYNTYFDAIVRYGNTPEYDGIDMILRDLAMELKQQPDEDLRKRFEQKLYKELAQTREKKLHTLQLRLLTLFAEAEEPGKTRDNLVATLLRERNVEFAGPLTLSIIGREAAARNKDKLTRSAYEALLERYGETDFTADALHGMAEFEIESGNYEAAVPLLNELLTRYATLPLAAEAQKRLGDVHRLQEQWQEAIATYQVLLSVRDWRGPLFPESLFWIGQCHLEQDQTEEAFAHFQRIYVLYGAYKEWVSRAYLKSAECLFALNQRSDAVATLNEMLSDVTLTDQPELKTARTLLDQWGASQ